MQRNLHEAQNKSYEVERGRPRLIMTKLRQLMQSRDTKNLNMRTRAATKYWAK